MEAPEELQAKLQTYYEQLEQVAQLLEMDPANDQFMKLQADLEEVIKLTTDMLVAAQQAVQEEAQAPQAVQEDPGAFMRKTTKGGAAFSPGSRVEALSNENWYPAVIQSIGDDGTTFNILYMGFGSEDTVSITSLRQIAPPPEAVDPAEAVVGFACQALFIGDGRYYDCVIGEVTPYGYKVKFKSYDNLEEVPLEYLKPPKRAKLLAVEDIATSANPQNNVAPPARPVVKPLPANALAEDGTFKIPDHLRLKPEDTPTEKERKRKKVKALKAQYRQQEKETESVSKQSSWQNFQNKGKKRTVIPGVAGKSIFASPDSVDGKVGVTGSGGGLTDFGQRKKFKPSSGF